MVDMGIFDDPKRVRVHVFLDEEQHTEIRQIAKHYSATASGVHRVALQLGLSELRRQLQHRLTTQPRVTTNPRQW